MEPACSQGRNKEHGGCPAKSYGRPSNAVITPGAAEPASLLDYFPNFACAGTWEAIFFASRLYLEVPLLAKQKGRWSAALNWGVGLPDGLLFLMGRYNARVQVKSVQLDRRERQGSRIIRRRRLIPWYPMCRSQIRREVDLSLSSLRRWVRLAAYRHATSMCGEPVFCTASVQKNLYRCSRERSLVRSLTCQLHENGAVVNFY
jgi:hypothetical protein